MNNLSSAKIISLLCLALLCCFSCCKAENSDALAAVMPDSNINLHLTGETTLDEILHTVLGPNELVAMAQGLVLADTLSFSSDCKEELKRMDGYVRCALLNPGTGFISIKHFQEYLPGIETRNYALLYKVKPSETSQVYQFMTELAGTRLEINIFDRLHHDFNARRNNRQLDLYVDEENNQFEILADQWYNILISLDQAYTYRYLVWQDTNPAAYIYQSYDLSSYFEDEDNPFASSAMAEITFSSDQQESWMDVEAVKVFKFDGAPEYPVADDDSNEETEPVQTITFIPQAVQPIEENPRMLPWHEIISNDFPALPVEEPQFNETTQLGDVAADILGINRELVTLQNEALMGCIDWQAKDSSQNQTLTHENGYVRAHIQTGGDGQNEAQDIWGRMFFNGLRDTIEQTGGMQQGSASAIALKLRYTGVNNGFSLFLENEWVTVFAGFSNSGSLNIYAMKDGVEFRIADLGDMGIDPINLIENEWYNMLLAIDVHYGCSFTVWQENDPDNHAFYACDLSDTFQSVSVMPNQYIWAGIDMWAHSNEIFFDIEALSVYEFVDFTGVDPATRTASQQYQYAGDDEKYRLAIQLFNGGDYYNAYLLLKELNGYDTSATYLSECERLLQTIVIENDMLARGIVLSTQNSGTINSPYLYVYQAEKIESLDLTECEIMDLEFIRYFPNLKQLILDGNGITDLTPLQDLYTLESLSIVRNGIADITPLYNLTNLQYLDLSNNVISDVSALGNLSRLKTLNVSMNNIDTLAGLYSLEALETVNLSYNFISSVNALSNSKLRELNIVNTNINSLWAVAGFDSLEVLKAGYCYFFIETDIYLLDTKYRSDQTVPHSLSGIEALSRLTNIKTLYLGWLATHTMEPFSQMPKLESLTLYDYSGPTDYDVLGGLTGLKELSLDGAGGGFESLHFLLTLTDLETLEIGGGSTSGGAWPIASLVNLKKLALSGFDTDLSFLTDLKQLRELRLDGWDNVDDYSPIASLDSLEYLELINTPMLDFSQISHIKTLRGIKIRGERINSIEGIGQLENLESLFLGVARFSKRSNREQLDQSLLDGLQNLKYVFVDIGGIDGPNVCYGMGSAEGVLTMDLPSESAAESLLKDLRYSEKWVNNLDDLNGLAGMRPMQYLRIILSLPEDIDEPVTITIPNAVRVLGITSNAKKPIAIALDCVDNIGLEKIFVGHLDYNWTENYNNDNGTIVIDNLDGLTGCTNLREVYINSAGITDISGLAGCEKLEVVELKENRIADISALADKRFLSYVKLRRNEIENFETLYSCIRLQELDVNLSKDKLKIIQALPLYGQ